MSSQRSEIWKIFDRLDAVNAICKICGTKMKHNGHTSNLIKHVKGQHHEWKPRKRVTSAPFAVKLEQMDSTTELCDMTANKTFEDYYTDTSHNKEVLDQKDPIAIPERTALSDRVSSLVNFLCHHQLPTHLVEDERFIRFVHSLASDYKQPTGFDLQQTITESYRSSVATMRQRIANAKNLSLTLNRWSDKQTNKCYIFATLYFVEDHAPVKCNIAVRELPEKRLLTDDYQQLFGKIFDQWSLKQSGINCYCITDDDPNMQQALQDVIQNKSALVMASLMDNTIVELIDSVLKNECVTKAVDVLRSVIEFMLETKRENATDQEMPQGISLNTPITDHKQVGVATLKMIERFLEIYDKAPDYAGHSPDASLLDVPLIRDLHQLLKPFDCALQELASRDYFELSILIPMMYCLKAQVASFTTVLDPLVPIHKMLEVELNRQSRSIESITQCAVATILDPRYKMLPFRDATASGKALQHLMRTIEDATVLLLVTPDERAPQTTNDFWRSLSDLEKSKGSQHNDMKDDEISLYLSYPLSARNTSPYKEWQKMRYMFPHLYEQAMMSLPVVASKELSKRSFDKACSLYHAFHDHKYGAEKCIAKKLEETLFMTAVNG